MTGVGLAIAAGAERTTRDDSTRDAIDRAFADPDVLAERELLGRAFGVDQRSRMGLERERAGAVPVSIGELARGAQQRPIEHLVV